MKLKEAEGYVRQKTLEEMEVNITDLVVSDEFNRRRAFDERNGLSFREHAVARLLEIREPFSTDQNIGWELRKQLITVTCPYCGAIMERRQGGASGGHESDEYGCPKKECKAKVSITYPTPGAVSVMPPQNLISEIEAQKAGVEGLKKEMNPHARAIIVKLTATDEAIGIIRVKGGKFDAVMREMWCGRYKTEELALQAISIAYFGV